MASCIESGLQLFARVRRKWDLSELQNTLFYNGLKSKDIVEIGGDASSGKTLFLTELLAKCILPMEYNGIRVDGCDAHAVLINTDHHFRVSNLTRSMSKILRSALAATGKQGLSNNVIDTIITESLDNLTIIECYNSDQFTLTLHTLEDILLKDEKIGLLAIDSISAFYWQDRENKGIWSLNTYVDNLMKIIKSYVLQFNIVTIYTRTNKFSLRDNAEETSNLTTANKISYKIYLHNDNKTQQLQCTVLSNSTTKFFGYTICDDGIKWSNESKTR